MKPMKITSKVNLKQSPKADQVIVGELESSATLTGHVYAPSLISAYQVAVDNGFKGSVDEWLATIVGPKGDPGESAYQLAKDLGFEGDEEAWIASLHGKSAYEIALELGFPPEGGEEAWLASLQGIDGKSAYDIAKEHGYPDGEEEWLKGLAIIDTHNQLNGRDEEDCHPMSSITNLDDTIKEVTSSVDQKQDCMLPMTVLDIYDICTF